MMDYKDRIKHKVSELMFNNPNLFPIAEGIILISKHYKIPEKDFESYVRIYIENRIGLDYIIRKKVEGIDEVRYSLPESKSLDEAVVRSVLLLYTDTNNSIKEFNNLFINFEKL